MSLEAVITVLALTLILLVVSIAVIIVSTIVRGIILVCRGLAWAFGVVSWLRRPRIRVVSSTRARELAMVDLRALPVVDEVRGVRPRRRARRRRSRVVEGYSE